MFFGLRRMLLCGMTGCVFMGTSVPARAQIVEKVVIDASGADAGAGAAGYTGGTAQSPKGDAIGVTSRY